MCAIQKVTGAKVRSDVKLLVSQQFYTKVREELNGKV